MLVDSSDSVVSEKIMSEGSWQPQLIYLISKLVHPGDTVLNLGSQTGMEAIVIGRIIGERGRMFIFEPYSISYRLMVKNIYLNGLNTVTKTYRLAAGIGSAKKMLNIDRRNTGHSSVVKEGSAMSINYEEIMIVAVDEIVPNSTGIDFGLIDVEDYQVEALLGMKELLKRSPKCILVVEWGGYALKSDLNMRELAEELLKWISRQGFKWYRYFGADDPCKITHIEEVDSMELMSIRVEDLILVGPQADVSHLFKSS